jgi:hypothetical protein
MENTKDNLVTIRQLSRKLNVSVIWLKTQADKNILPCVNANGKLFFNLKSVKIKLAELAARGQGQ